MCTSERLAKSVAETNGMARLERLEIERHRKELSRQQGRDVSFDEAKASWDAHYASDWRMRWQQEYLAKQREEILKHKWIESEKARRDLGALAVFEWIDRYAAEWRAAYEREQERRLREQESSTGVENKQ